MGIGDQRERNSAIARHPPSPKLRRGHLALYPHSELRGIRAEVSETSKESIMSMGSRQKDEHLMRMLALIILFTLPFVGCAVTPMETHKQGMENLTEKEYFIPSKPVDRHFIGCAWSRQFGPVEDPAASDIRIKIERSFDAMKQNFAYNLGLSMGGQSIQGTTVEVKGGQDIKGGAVSIKGPTVEAGVEGGKTQRAQLEDVQIITPVSLADIPFEPDIPYVTEALRLGNFELKSQAGAKAGVTALAGPGRVGAKAETLGDAGTTGQGLVVAYKLHRIDPKTYSRQDSGRVTLELEKTVDFPKADLFLKPQLRVIEAGADKPLPRNLLWSCDQADARSKDMVAAWVIELRSRDPKRKSLQIAFPAFPKIGDCQNFSGVIYSRIDPLTDKIIRQKISISILNEELSDSLKPLNWEAQASLVDESFNIKLVKQGDLGK